MSKFIALSVGQGDAFYYERDDFRMLVDGGKSRTAISPWMNTICHTDCLDVLICTHNDIDHANGVAGLLENWEGCINEVWLPGSWTYRLRDLFINPHDFFFELESNLFDYQKNDNYLDLEAFYRSNDCTSTADINNEEIFDLCEVVESSNSFPSNLLDYFLFHEVLFYNYIKRHSTKNLRLLQECIDAATNIKRIAKSAYHRGCKIKFFEYGHPAIGGLPGSLEPVNSRELSSITSKRIHALQYLALSSANKESLVFICPEQAKNPSILFTADSDLNSVFNLPLHNQLSSPIITCPHHGSETNHAVYTKISALLNPVHPFWIRSDSKSHSRPGQSFKQQKNKFCTLCNCGTHTKQTVKLTTINGHWQIDPNTRACTCT